MSKSLGIAACAAIAVAVAACVPGQNQAIDREVAATQIADALRQKMFFGTGHTQYPCAEFFELLEVVVSDERSEDGTAQVEAQVRVKALKEGPQHGYYTRLMAKPACYGSPEGWFTGRVASGPFVAQFQRWEKGWRLSGLTGNVVRVE